MQDFKQHHKTLRPVRSTPSKSFLKGGARRGMSGITGFSARQRKIKRWTKFNEEAHSESLKKAEPFSWFRLSVKMGGIVLFLFMMWIGREMILEAIRLSNTPLQNIYIQGNSMLSRFEVLRVTGIQPGVSWNTLDSPRISRSLNQHPYVFRVSIRKRFPDSLFIQLQEYTPVAVLQSGSQYYLMDQQQRILQPVSSEASLPYPLFTGLSLENLTPGQVLHSANIQQGLSFLQKVNTQISAENSDETANNVTQKLLELDVSDLLNMKVLLKISAEDNSTVSPPPLLLKLGNNQLSARLSHFQKLYPLLKDKHPNLKEVDLRFRDRMIFQ